MYYLQLFVHLNRKEQHPDIVPICQNEKTKTKKSPKIGIIFLKKSNTFTILPKVLAPLLMKGLTTLVISMSTNLNIEAYNDILGNLIVYQQFGQNSFLF